MPKDPLPRGPFRVRAVTVTDPVTGKTRVQRIPPAGISDWSVRRHCRRLFNGIYVDRTVAVDEHALAVAALLLHDQPAAASHQTAARIWGGAVPDDGLVHIATTGPTHDVRGIRSRHVAGTRPVITIRGIAVVSPDQTFLDLGTELGLVDLVVLGDSLVKAGRTTPEALVSAARGFTGAGCRTVRRAAALVRRHVDSPMESRLRMLLVLAGLPEPTINHIVCREDGTVRYRFDLSYPGFRLIIEYDGRQHADDSDQWHHDISRREWLDSERWRIMIIRANDIYGTPGLTLQRVVEAMRSCGMKVGRLSPEWRYHFPGRGPQVDPV